MLLLWGDEDAPGWKVSNSRLAVAKRKRDTLTSGCHKLLGMRKQTFVATTMRAGKNSNFLICETENKFVVDVDTPQAICDIYLDYKVNQN
jgi:hypothetical protein